MKNIKFNLFQKYACSDKSKRRNIGTHAGEKTVLSEDNYDLLCEAAIRDNRAKMI